MLIQTAQFQVCHNAGVLQYCYGVLGDPPSVSDLADTVTLFLSDLA